MYIQSKYKTIENEIIIFDRILNKRNILTLLTIRKTQILK